MIDKIINRILDRRLHKSSYEATVISVDKIKDTCVIQAEDGPVIEGVKLKSVITDAAGKLVVYPREGSFVTVSILHNLPNELFVSQISQVDEIVMDIDNTITINGGNNGGLVNWRSVKAELDKTNDVVNTIVDALKNWVVVPNDGGAALQTYFNAAIPGKDVGNFDDKEDTKVKH